ncbi:MAG: 50S ribosomal protein L29 [Phycisphaeraceae bacterium]|nr:50S ribosomal protein L29 [Phycisphaeraceae bacterium]MCW5769882.1 50S ribosomal protein L29 [Phycisphaeraceae bacterium]
MKSKEVKTMTADDLNDKLTDLRHKVYNLRVQAVTQKIEDNSQIGKAKRDIARLLTERRARQIAATTNSAS